MMRRCLVCGKTTSNVLGGDVVCCCCEDVFSEFREYNSFVKGIFFSL